MDNIWIQDTDGIIHKDVKTSIANLAEIDARGMVETERMVLRLLLSKG
jgi:Uncharacterized conserved protein